jgi:hypothetical protein
MASSISVDHRLSAKLRAMINMCTSSPAESPEICSHDNLRACVELGRSLSRKVSMDAFLFKETKGS